MSNDQHRAPEEPPARRCALCGRRRRVLQTGVCKPCAEETLRRHIPDLTHALERRYGRALDDWVAVGHFTVACWQVEPEFEVKEERLLPFLTAIIRDALRERALSLALPDVNAWVPEDARAAATVLREHCGRGLRHFLSQHLEMALRGMSTEAAERELVEALSGRKHARRRTRRAALDAAAFTSANPLRDSAAVLLQLRYGGEEDVEFYTEVSEGEIDAVWREVEELLPGEVAALLHVDGSVQRCKLEHRLEQGRSRQVTPDHRGGSIGRS